MFDSHSRFALMRYLLGFTMGRLEKVRGVSYVQAPSLRVESETEVPVEVDGELAGHTPVEFFALKDKLNVIVPAAQEHGGTGG